MKLKNINSARANKDKVYYIGFYNNPESDRFTAVPAITKMNYIIDSLNQGGLNVDVISPSFINKNKCLFEKGGFQKLNSMTRLWLPPSLSVNFKIGNYFFSRISFLIWFFKLFTLKSYDTVILYHSPVFSLPIRIVKKLIGFQLIIEIEEIYSYAFGRNNHILQKELRLIKSSNKQIIVNDLISNQMKLDRNNNIVCYGPYRINYNVEPIKFKDNKIHIIYAGSFSQLKGGVHHSIEAAKYLPVKYVMHILGFGTKEETLKVKEQIKLVNELDCCEVRFEGVKYGDELHSFMKGCTIGLNPQKWGDYMLYAFPSKVLVYFCMGLNVVTSPLKTLTSSTLSHYFNYFYQETPESIAKAIINAKLFHSDQLNEVITDLHNNFVQELVDLINK